MNERIAGKLRHGGSAQDVSRAESHVHAHVHVVRACVPCAVIVRSEVRVRRVAHPRRQSCHHGDRLPLALIWPKYKVTGALHAGDTQRTRS